jgi:hypothetical protein
MGSYWIILVLGLILLVSSLHGFWQVYRARSFLPVPGHVTDRSVARAPYFGVTGGLGWHVPAVKYTYAVNGSDYTGDRFALVPHRYGLKRAEVEVAKVPDDLAVFVNPRNPADAVIDRRGIGAVVMNFAIAVIGLLYVLVCMRYQ